MEILHEYDDWKDVIFQCHCHVPGCCLYIDIEREKDKDDPCPVFSFSLYQSAYSNLWERIKWAFKYIFKGERVCLGVFILREQDRKGLIDLLVDKNK